MIKYVVIFVVVAMSVGGWWLWTNDGTKAVLSEELVEPQVQEVAVRVLGEESQPPRSVHAFGAVISSTGVDLVPELSGVVKRVHVSLGQAVRAGQLIISLDDASAREQVRQAQAGVQTAQATLDTTLKGADEAGIAASANGVALAESTLSSTRSQILSALDGHYATLSETLSGTVDPLFFANTSAQYPDFRYDINDKKLETDLGQGRRIVELAFDGDREYEDPKGALSIFTLRVQEVRDLVITLRDAIAQADFGSGISLQTKEAWKSDLIRVGATLNQLDVAQASWNEALAQARTNELSARLAYSNVIDGASNEDVSRSQAALIQARSSLKQANITLAKTRITSPVVGQVGKIKVRTGEVVAPGTVVASVDNPSLLRIDTGVSLDQLAYVVVGAEVEIDGAGTGRVSQLGRRVNGRTGKVAVEVIPQRDHSLVAGQVVALRIVDDTTTAGVYRIPIESLAVNRQGAYVYVVNQGTATRRSVETGDLFGEMVEVSSGLEAGTVLILDARGLKEGQMVQVTNQ